jgi:WD40-like Beta Propeller Repeat
MRYQLFAALCAATVTAPLSAQARRPGAPEEHLPPEIAQLVAFGERPAFSPDGKRIAFIGRSFGDAFEIDLGTHLIRLLSGHFKHAGLLRIQYLPNGDYFIIGARDFRDATSTRYQDEEMWIMKADAKSAPIALDHKIFEGIAISRTRMHVAWSNNHSQYPERYADGESAIYTADIDTAGGGRKLTNVTEVIRARLPECNMEPQDFRFDDTELIYTCYRENGTKADVMGVNLTTHAVTTFRKVADEYNEAEGVTPDGRFVMVESSHDQGSAERQTFHYIDIWKMALELPPRTFERMTRFGEYEGYKASNPVVSNDGRWMSFQAGRSTDAPGIGYGIFLMKLR